MATVLWLRLSVLEALSWEAGLPEEASFGGGVTGLSSCERRAMAGGAHLSARRGEWQRRLRAGSGGSSYGESGNRIEAMAQEGVDRHGRSGLNGPKSKGSFKIDLIF
jgi:hypothetical protein